MTSIILLPIELEKAEDPVVLWRNGKRLLFLIA